MTSSEASMPHRKMVILAVALSLVLTLSLSGITSLSSFRLLGRIAFLICIAFVLGQMTNHQLPNIKVLSRLSRRLSNSTPNLTVLGLYRIAFGILTTITACRALKAFEVLFFNLDHPLTRNAVYFGLVIWGGIGLSLAAGFGGRALRGINLIISALLLRNFYTFGIFESTYTLNAWLALLTPCDFRLTVTRSPIRSVPNSILNSALPLFFVGLHFGFVFLYVGLDKLLCPLWADGTGFYNFASLPWVLPSYLEWLTDYQVLMQLGNWGGLIVEVLFIVAWTFKSSRPIAVLGIFMLTAGLCYPFNIFLIGPLAVTFSLGLSSILKLSDFSTTQQATLTPCSAWFLIPVYSMIFFIPDMMETFLHPWPRENNVAAFRESPPWNPGQDVTEQTRRPTSTSLAGELANDLHGKDLLYAPWNTTGDWFLAAKRYALFSKRHTLGMYGYRIQIETKSGERIEPVQYFAADCERPSLWDGWLELNCYQGAMYSIGDVARWASFGRLNETRLGLVGTTLVDAFMQKSIKTSQLEQESIDKAILLVKAMETSRDWQGNLETSVEGWTELIVYFPETGKYALGPQPKQHVVQGRDPATPNYLPHLYESQKNILKDHQ